jgi:hypothetical protein
LDLVSSNYQAHHKILIPVVVNISRENKGWNLREGDLRARLEGTIPIAEKNLYRARISIGNRQVDRAILAQLDGGDPVRRLTLGG